MSDRGQRIDLRFGGVAVEVSLQKTSGKPTEAKYETRRMIGDVPAELARARVLRALSKIAAVGAIETERSGEEPTDGFTLTSEHRDRSDAPAAPLLVTDEAQGRFEQATTPPDPFADLPPERIEHGVHLPIDGEHPDVQGGQWIDLTAQLAEIDERTRIDGMEVVATIDSTSVPRHRVRDSYWLGLAPDAQGTPKVLALLWTGLRKQRRAAVVKWTKRTNQALGIIVASGARDGHGYAAPSLVLLEIEWSANMRKPSTRATEPLRVSCSLREEAAALALVEALAEPPSFLDSVRDERTAKRAELLEAARAGKVEEFVPPPEPAEADNDLAEALAP